LRSTTGWALIAGCVRLQRFRRDQDGFGRIRARAARSAHLSAPRRRGRATMPKRSPARS